MRHLGLIFLAGAAIAAACAPVENQRGYVPDQEAVSSIAVGVDTKDMISKKLGDPSTSATFGGDTWYYISSHVEQNAFFAPRAIDRNIVAVEFTKEGKVANVHKYTLADGRVVDLVSRVTPTRGRELTLLQQIFNAVPGQIGPSAPPDQQPGAPGPSGPGGPGIPGPGRY
jgi:outer membrane protein assembly factor BamE (lipoprotein component of BamABCDE complex)